MYKFDQKETPLFDALMEYVNRDTLPFHVPGHKKGVGIDEEFKNFIGENPFKIDVTVFKLVDSLHHPTGPIKKAQMLQLMPMALMLPSFQFMEPLVQFKP